MPTKLVNLTPHDIVLQAEDGVRQVVPPAGTTARVAVVASEEQARLPGVSVPIQGPNQWGDVEGLPEPEWGTVYIVSALVAEKVKRPDVVMPGTGPKDGAIRENGQIVAVTKLIRSA